MIEMGTLENFGKIFWNVLCRPGEILQVSKIRQKQVRHSGIEGTRLDLI